MMGAVVTARNAHFAMIIPFMGYVLAYIFPVYVNIFKRDQMDSHRASDLNVAPRPADTEKDMGIADEGEDKNVTVEEREDKRAVAA
jgi:FHS family L-fucose permease-like MFS transporter